MENKINITSEDLDQANENISWLLNEQNKYNKAQKEIMEMLNGKI